MKTKIKNKVKKWLDINFEYRILSVIKIMKHSRKKRITIVFYLHTRSKYLIKILFQLSQVKDINNFAYFLFIVDSKTSTEDVRKIIVFAEKKGILFDVFKIETYWKKVLLASHSRSHTIIKWDEDIYMSSLHASNLLSCVKNRDWEDIDVISPIISTGIPTFEYFLDYYMDEKNARSIRHTLEVQKFIDWWGSKVEYTSLNDSYKAENWKDFFSKVSQLKHPYKGMHPIRMSDRVQKTLNEWLLNNRKWETWSPPSNILRLDVSPYFCNSVFCCSPKFLRLLVKKVKRGKLFFDGYDEIALNGLCDERGRKIGFMADALAIHPSYNSIGVEFEDISQNFFERI